MGAGSEVKTSLMIGFCADALLIAKTTTIKNDRNKLLIFIFLNNYSINDLLVWMIPDLITSPPTSFQLERGERTHNFIMLPFKIPRDLG
jgi:hypothetical protein